MQKQIPGTVVIGSVESGSKQFDDLLQLGQKQYKICNFKISIDDEKICGISFTYEKILKGRKRICSDTCTTGKKINQYEFEIPKDDFIQVIFGYYQSGITQLGLITSKGQQAIFGKDQGYKFNYLFMGYTFTKAFGSYKKGIQQQLGFRVVKLPKEFLEQNVKISDYIKLSPLVNILYSNNPSDSIVVAKFGTTKEFQQYQYPYQQLQQVMNSDTPNDVPISDIFVSIFPLQVSTQPSQTYDQQRQNPYKQSTSSQQPYQYQQLQHQQQYPQQQQPYYTQEQDQNQEIVVSDQQQSQQIDFRQALDLGRVWMDGGYKFVGLSFSIFERVLCLGNPYQAPILFRQF